MVGGGCPLWVSLVRPSHPPPPLSCSQMSAVIQDLLRHLNVEQHPCLRGPFETRCGLSPTHPATLGVSVYEFNDTETGLTGHAAQTEVAGICLDAACIKITTVALHRPSLGSAPPPSARHGGVAACSYQLVPGGSLTSMVAAMATVEEVNISALAAERGVNLSDYGVVVRHADRTWRAEVFRDVRAGRAISEYAVLLCERAVSRSSVSACPEKRTGTNYGFTLNVFSCSLPVNFSLFHMFRSCCPSLPTLLLCLAT